MMKKPKDFLNSNCNSRCLSSKPVCNSKRKLRKERKWKGFLRKWKNVLSQEAMSWKKKKKSKHKLKGIYKQSLRRKRGFKKSSLKKKRDRKICFSRKKSTTTLCKRRLKTHERQSRSLRLNLGELKMNSKIFIKKMQKEMKSCLIQSVNKLRNQTF